MPYQVKLNNRLARVELLHWQDSTVIITVDGKEYTLDFEKVSPGSFSILHNHISYNLELVPGDTVKRYTINTYKSAYEAEIIDAESQYLAARNKGMDQQAENAITAPIPGKVVRIPVEVGDQVDVGQTLIIISAMKMESEFKAKKAGTVKEIRVKEGDTVEARKMMIIVE